MFVSKDLILTTINFQTISLLKALFPDFLSFEDFLQVLAFHFFRIYYENTTQLRTTKNLLLNKKAVCFIPLLYL